MPTLEYRRTAVREMRQLTAMAFAVIEADPNLDDGEWLHVLKCELLAQGYTYPQPWSLMAAAIERVKGASRRKWNGKDRPPARQQTQKPSVYARAALVGLNLRTHTPIQLAAIRRAANTPEAYDAIREAEKRERTEGESWEWG